MSNPEEDLDVLACGTRGHSRSHDTTGAGGPKDVVAYCTLNHSMGSSTRTFCSLSSVWTPLTTGARQCGDAGGGKGEARIEQLYVRLLLSYIYI